MHLANVLPGSSSVQVLVDSYDQHITVIGLWLIIVHKMVNDSQKVGNLSNNKLYS